MKLTALTNKLLIQKEYIEKIGSIFIPEEAVAESVCGIVLSVGDQVHKVIDVQVGDKVHFPKYIGCNFTIKGKKYFAIEAEHVILKEEIKV